LAAARRDFDYALSTLLTMPTRIFTRPLVIVLSHGLRHGWLLLNPEPALLPTVTEGAFDPARAPRVTFEPQRTIALRRARGLAAVLAAALVLVAVYAAW
jgi:hypothetical protein